MQEEEARLHGDLCQRVGGVRVDPGEVQSAAGTPTRGGSGQDGGGVSLCLSGVPVQY